MKTTRKTNRAPSAGKRTFESWSATRDRILADPEVRFHYDELLIREQVGETISKARRTAGITQVEIAKRAGTTQSVIARLERGNGGVPSLPMLARIAGAMGLQLMLGFRFGARARGNRKSKKSRSEG